MRKVSLIERPGTNSLAYLLCQTRQRATDYRPGMTPEDVRAVSEKSVRQHETTRAQVVRHQTVAPVQSGERSHAGSAGFAS